VGISIKPTIANETIENFLNDLDFALFKKKLQHSYPLFMPVIVDEMYPLIRFSDRVVIMPFAEGPKRGEICVHWDGSKLHLGIICSIKTNDEITICNLKDKNPFTISHNHLFGQVSNFSLNFFLKLKLLFWGRL
jgi:hypothetical protein